MSGIFTSLFHLVFGRPGARTAPRRTPPAPTHPPPPASAAPPPADPPRAPAPPAPIPEPPAPAGPPPALEGAPEPQPAPAPEQPPAPAPELPPEPAPPPPAAAEPAPASPEPAPPAAPAPSPAAPDDQLTPHFRLSEFTRSETAQQLGVANTPEPEHLPNIQRAAAGMERIRAILGGKPITVTSGYRNPQVNAAVGGVANSAHALGHAVDFKCPGFGTPYQIVERLMNDQAFMADVDQLIFEFNTWVHVSFDPRKRAQVLTAHKNPPETRTLYVAGLKQVDNDGRLLNA